jgi:dihydrofolate reductase
MTPEIIYYVACSVDGFIATEDGGVDWLEPFQKTGEDHGAGELQASIDALLLGSGTYEFALKFGSWPSPNIPSWVFTRPPSETTSSEYYADVGKPTRSR